MKNRIIVFLIIILLLAGIGVGLYIYIRQAAPTTPPGEIDPTAKERGAFEFSTDPSEIEWDDREVFKGGLVEDSQFILEELPLASTYYISMEIPDDLISDLQGHQIVRYFNAEEVPLDRVYFRLFPNFQGGSMIIRDLHVNGDPTVISLESEDTTLKIDLPQALEPGESVTFEMDFTLGIPTEMGGNYGLFGYFEDVLVLDTFYPMIPAYDQDDGWYRGYPQPNGDHTYNDASFYVVQATAPKDLVLASSGIMIDHQVENGIQKTTFAAGPARDFYLAGSREFTVLEEQTGDLTVRVLTKEEYSAHQKFALEFARDAIVILSNRVGDYTYTEFEVMSSPMAALGIEYPGITSIVVDEFVEGGEMYGAPTVIFLESTVVHEVGHMWFYNTVGNDQQNEPWLDEALVQYLTYIYYLDKYGNGDGYVDSWYSRWSRVDYEEIPIGMPAREYYDDETGGAAYSAIVYGRGPLFFLELEKELGLDVLMSGIQNYYRDNLWEEGQPEDLREALEASCACDLSEYFEAWVYNP